MMGFLFFIPLWESCQFYYKVDLSYYLTFETF
jgi:hypothetical protein